MSKFVEEIVNTLKSNNIICSFIGENKQVKSVKTLKNAAEDDISFFANNKYRKYLHNTTAGVCLIKLVDADLLPQSVTKIICDDPYLAFAFLLDIFYLDEYKFTTDSAELIHSSAYISKSAKIGHYSVIKHNSVIEDGVTIGDKCFIGASVYIGKDVIIGNNVHIAPNVTLVHCEIGDDCIIHSGVRVGQDGFGFTLDTQKQIKKIQQIGKAIIGRNVEIGANSCIDRGAIDDTIIGDCTKIDNLVQIGHNVIIGKNCFIAGQAGIAGSTIIGDYVMIGGQAGTSGHIQIGNMVQIAGKSGVMEDLKDGAKVGGYPATDIFQWHKQTAFLRNIVKKK